MYGCVMGMALDRRQSVPAEHEANPDAKRSTAHGVWCTAWGTRRGSRKHVINGKIIIKPKSRIPSMMVYWIGEAPRCLKSQLGHSAIWSQYRPKRANQRTSEPPPFFLVIEVTLVI